MTQPYRKPERVTPDDWAKGKKKKVTAPPRIHIKLYIHTRVRIETMKMKMLHIKNSCTKQTMP